MLNNLIAKVGLCLSKEVRYFGIKILISCENILMPFIVKTLTYCKLSPQNIARANQTIRLHDLRSVAAFLNTKASHIFLRIRGLEAFVVWKLSISIIGQILFQPEWKCVFCYFTSSSQP